METMRTIKELAIEAIGVQNACNLQAVINGMAQANKDLRAQMSWDEADRHPIMLLWLDKIAHLTRYPQNCPNEVWNKVFQMSE